MTVGAIAPEMDDFRWHRIITLLSLDVVRPFYDMMGLRLIAADHFQQILRQEIIVVRKRWAVAQPEDLRLDVSAIIEGITRSVTAEDMRRLHWWERNIFSDDPRDNMNLARWNSVLQDCSYEHARWARLGLPTGISEEAFKRFRQSGNIKTYQKLQDELDKQRLSDWDLHIYALHLYDDNLYDEVTIALQDGPRLWLKPTIRDKQRYDFWTWLLSVLPAKQIDQLFEIGCQIVVDEELRSAKNLPHPSVLDIQL